MVIGILMVPLVLTAILSAMATSGPPGYEELQAENDRLRRELLELQARQHGVPETATDAGDSISTPPLPPLPVVEALTAPQISRYSRQLLVSEFAVQGQKRLLSSSVLVIGAGGLGSTVLLYLAAAGIGRLGIVDFDVVATSNLHRQVIHEEAADGKSKARSAQAAVLRLNSAVDCRAYETRLTPENGVGLVRQYDLVVDASDNPWTRYLVSDACVLAGKPLVSAAALGTEGQATVYNHQGGPCYRCIHPKPMAAEANRSCSDNGVLGPVPGVMGCLQAMEAVKVLAGVGDSLSQRLLTYDSMTSNFRVFKLPARSPSCAACGTSPTIKTLHDTAELAVAHGLGTSEGPACRRPQEVPPGSEITCQELSRLRSSGEEDLVLLDVRDAVQFDICRLPEARNLPYKQLAKDPGALPSDKPVYVMCRRGILSAAATKLLLDHGFTNVRNVRGGLTAWHYDVDPSFPLY